jgi:hypothetical protein
MTKYQATTISTILIRASNPLRGEGGRLAERGQTCGEGADLRRGGRLAESLKTHRTKLVPASLPLSSQVCPCPRKSALVLLVLASLPLSSLSSQVLASLPLSSQVCPCPRKSALVLASPRKSALVPLVLASPRKSALVLASLPLYLSDTVNAITINNRQLTIGD